MLNAPLNRRSAHSNSSPAVRAHSFDLVSKAALPLASHFLFDYAPADIYGQCLKECFGRTSSRNI
jgi:hypothetical protein